MNETKTTDFFSQFQIWLFRRWAQYRNQRYQKQEIFPCVPPVFAKQSLDSVPTCYYCEISIWRQPVNSIFFHFFRWTIKFCISLQTHINWTFSLPFLFDWMRIRSLKIENSRRWHLLMTNSPEIFHRKSENLKLNKSFQPKKSRTIRNLLIVQMNVIAKKFC